jgi:hypothetical protein
MDLVTMSQTPTARPGEAAVTRINQLTERMLTGLAGLERDDHPVEQAD